MPVYQYVCTACGEPLEVRQSFTDDALTVCPTCEGRLRKVLSPVGVVFKGSGFYRTDSRASANGGQHSSASNGHKDHNGTSKDSTSSSTEKATSSSGSDSTSGSSGSDSGSKSTSSSSSSQKAAAGS